MNKTVLMFLLLFYCFSCKHETTSKEKTIAAPTKIEILEKSEKEKADDFVEQKDSLSASVQINEKIEIVKNWYAKEKCLAVKKNKDFQEELFKLIQRGIYNNENYVDIKDYLVCIKMLNPDKIADNLFLDIKHEQVFLQIKLHKKKGRKKVMTNSFSEVFPFLKENAATFISFESSESTDYKNIPNELKHIYQKLEYKVEDLRARANAGDEKASAEYRKIESKNKFRFQNLSLFPELMKKRFWIISEQGRYETKIKAIEFDIAVECGLNQINLVFEENKNIEGRILFAVTGKDVESIPELGSFAKSSVSKYFESNDFDGIAEKIKIFPINNNKNIVSSMDSTFSSINIVWDSKLKQVDYLHIISGDCYGSYSVEEKRNYILNYGKAYRIYRFSENSVTELFYDGIEIHRKFIADTMCPEI